MPGGNVIDNETLLGWRSTNWIRKMLRENQDVVGEPMLTEQRTPALKSSPDKAIVILHHGRRIQLLARRKFFNRLDRWRVSGTHPTTPLRNA
jgi:hypothetical protein